MGYTHYWDKPRQVSLEKWDAFQKDVKTIFDNESFPIQHESDDDTPPTITNEVIRFNGIGDDGHETFLLARSDDGSWAFCKTARKPYDLAVCVVLYLAERHGVVDKFHSDGKRSEQYFPKARRIIRKYSQK